MGDMLRQVAASKPGLMSQITGKAGMAAWRMPLSTLARLIFREEIRLSAL